MRKYNNWLKAGVVMATTLLVVLLLSLGLPKIWVEGTPKTWEFGLSELEGFAEFSFSAEEDDRFAFSTTGYGYYPAGSLLVTLEEEELSAESLFGVLTPAPVRFEKSLTIPVPSVEGGELKFRAAVFGSTGSTLDFYLRKTSQSVLWGTPEAEAMSIEGLGESGIEVASIIRSPDPDGEGYLYYGKTYLVFQSDSRVKISREASEEDDYSFVGGSKYDGEGSALSEVPSGPASLEVEGNNEFKITAGGDDHIHLLLDGVGLDNHSVSPHNSTAYHDYEEFSLTGYFPDGGIREVELEGS